MDTATIAKEGRLIKPLRSVEIDKPTMFCSTAHCMHPAVVAVVEEGSNIIYLMCVDCVWKIVKKGEASNVEMRGLRMSGQAMVAGEGDSSLLKRLPADGEELD